MEQEKGKTFQEGLVQVVGSYLAMELSRDMYRRKAEGLEKAMDKYTMPIALSRDEAVSTGELIVKYKELQKKYEDLVISSVADNVAISVPVGVGKTGTEKTPETSIPDPTERLSYSALRERMVKLNKENEELRKEVELLNIENNELQEYKVENIKRETKDKAIIEVLYRVRAWYYGLGHTGAGYNLTLGSLGAEVVSQLFEGVMNESAQKEEKAKNLPGPITKDHMPIPKIISERRWYLDEKRKFIQENGLYKFLHDDQILLILSIDGTYTGTEPLFARMTGEDLLEWKTLWEENPDRGEVLYPIKLALKGEKYNES